jgi:hypothetical protein
MSNGNNLNQSISRRRFLEVASLATASLCGGFREALAAEVQIDSSVREHTRQPVSMFGSAILQMEFPYFTSRNSFYKQTIGVSGDSSIDSLMQKLNKKTICIVLAGEMCPHLDKSLPTFADFARNASDSLFVLAHGCVKETAKKYAQGSRHTANMIHLVDPKINITKISPLAVTQNHGDEHDHGPNFYSSTFFLLERNEKGQYSVIQPDVRGTSNPNIGGGAWSFTKNSFLEAARILGVKDTTWVPEKHPMNVTKGCSIVVCSHSQGGSK